MHLLNAIQTTDASLQAAIAYIKSTEMDPQGLMSDFESTAAYLIQFDPVSKKRKHSSGRGQQINKVVELEDGSDDSGDEQQVSSAKRLKPNKGKTGVEFRYYKPEEYRKLSKEQKDELRQKRQEDQSNGKDDPKKKKGNKRKETRQIRKQVVAVLKSLSKEEEESCAEEKKLEEMIVSVVNNLNNSKKGSNSKPSKTTTLKAIAKRLNGKDADSGDDS